MPLFGARFQAICFSLSFICSMFFEEFSNKCASRKFCRRKKNELRSHFFLFRVILTFLVANDVGVVEVYAGGNYMLLVIIYCDLECI